MLLCSRAPESPHPEGRTNGGCGRTHRAGHGGRWTGLVWREGLGSDAAQLLLGLQARDLPQQHPRGMSGVSSFLQRDQPQGQMEPHQPSHQHCFSVSPWFKCQWPWVGPGILARDNTLPHQASAQGTQSPSQRYPPAPRRAGHTPPAATTGSAPAERAEHAEQEKGHGGGPGATGPAPEQPDLQVDRALRQDRHLQVSRAGAALHTPTLGVAPGQGVSRCCGSQKDGPPCLTQDTHTGVHAQGCRLGHTWEWWDGWEPHEPAPKPKREVWGEA